MIENLQETIKGLITFFSVGIIMMLILGPLWGIIKQFLGEIEN